MANPIVANTGTAIGSLLGTIGTLSNAISSTISTGVRGVEMLDTYVSNASNRQQTAAKIDMEDYIERLLEEKSIEVSQRQLQVDKFTNQSTRNQELYAKNYDRFAALVRPPVKE
jgi:hypothetical protein